jgi:endonuclease/exonuclease/phosphatase (EEP) superfamily protein YafD
VLSKFPLKEITLPALHADPALALLNLNIKGRSVKLLAMHSTRPSSGAPYHKNQIHQFEQIATLINSTKDPVLLIGDLNISPWNYSFKLLTQKTGLNNSMDSFGFQPSFPTFVPKLEDLPIFPVIPIDHVLISSQFQTLNRYTGSKLQSDHLPVITELGLKKQY